MGRIAYGVKRKDYDYVHDDDDDDNNNNNNFEVCRIIDQQNPWH
jgi:hypothetical protein